MEVKYQILNINCPSFKYIESSLLKESIFIKFENLKREEYSLCKVKLILKDKEINLTGQIYLKKTTKQWLLNAIDGNSNQISLVLFFPNFKIINL